jgi:hypothetical protein
MGVAISRIYAPIVAVLVALAPGVPMASDDGDLRALNLAINKAENSGDRNYLAGVLAPELAFMRADGKTIDDAGRFLQKVAKKPEPGELEIDTLVVEVLGSRAIVKCVVAQGGKRYHNVRLFVRLEGQWKLLGWANEVIASPTN